MYTKRQLLLSASTGFLFLPALTGAAARSRNGPRAAYFPNPVLRTHEGRKVRFYDDLIAGRIVVVNMMYTYCSQGCPPAMASLLKVQDALGDRVGRDVHMYSITLQPELDTPEVLRDYAAKLGIGRGWQLLTGGREDLAAVRRSLGFSDPDPARDAEPMRHTGQVRIGNEALDRWLVTPALGSTRQILSKINGLA